ncbi:MAG: hypothetical protein MSC45_00265 [Mobiluncus sp.]|uniref:hypothetical protein n=1 Tax=Mobiluncus sp. TaxID=47293 RepID=UPI0025836E3D|nr:hypothetical protein [Mobiluncus sp.]MCI6583489.1 hypothetical protein [Mobiluncus sp.]
MEFDLFPDSGLGAGKAQTVSKKSAVLWSVLREAYQSLGFDKAVNDEAFELLVLGRIVEPVSKSDTIRVLRELGLEAPHENTFYNCLRRAAGRDYRSRVAEACFAHASRAGDLSLVLYDVTTLYFEAEN